MSLDKLFKTRNPVVSSKDFWPTTVTKAVQPAISTTEKVNHPKHYNEHPSGVECIVIVEHYDFCIGNAMKYLWRNGLKGGESNIDDLKKAVWYIQREIANHEKDNPDTR